ncbi:N,N'-diacetyllegionaminic acid synthase [Candidatus Terasakiella magnetica]|nr:N,N'-diacetyllegionaminic acid synthase [Candidatus Terasakiella magnetica]
MSRCLVIAEAGVNHNGSPEMAAALVRAAADAGADVIKFQTFKADKLAVKSAPKADYQRRTTGEAETQLEMLRRLELSEATHHSLVEQCRLLGITFLSTPFELDSLHFLTSRLGLDTIKIPSGEMLNAPLLLATAQSGVNIILSTGMSDLQEVEQALGVLAHGYLADSTCPPSRQAFAAAWASPGARTILAQKVCLLHCTTEYPASFDSVNLRAMDTLAAAFGLKVGFSDHTLGIAAPLAAVARGACVVEKHFTLDRTLPGPDHEASLTPVEFAAMVRGIREVEDCLGDGIKQPAPCELPNRRVARKSLVALRPIGRGELFTVENLGVKRPGTGVSPLEYYDRLGQPAEHDFAQDEVLV